MSAGSQKKIENRTFQYKICHTRSGAKGQDRGMASVTCPHSQIILLNKSARHGSTGGSFNAGNRSSAPGWKWLINRDQESHKKRLHDVPDHRECEGRVNVDEETGHLIRIVKNETISPRYDCACDSPMAESVTCDKKRTGLRENPEEDKVENADIVA
jgi:hypothetical protein